MSIFNANSQAFNMVTENELTEVLSHYSSEFVFSIIDEALKRRFLSVPIIPFPNVVGAWEQNFKAIRSQYGPESQEEIMRVRNETYEEIINIICTEFNFNFTIDDSIDMYSAAYHLYDFVVCNFSNNMISFFANYIYKERSSIYDILGLSEMKKNKDTSTIYGKKRYKDIKLAVINANIDMVIQEVSNMDIDFYTIISMIYGNNSELKKYFTSIISPTDSFINKVYLPVINSDIRPDIVTGIRFKLQEIATIHDQTISSDEMEVFNNQDNNE